MHENPSTPEPLLPLRDALRGRYDIDRIGDSAAEAVSISNVQSRQYPISREVTRSPPCLPLGIGYSWDWLLDIEIE
jgi:hypothetical protein